MNNIFISNLKNFLKQKKLTQSQFAKDMGSSNASVSNYLSNQSEPPLSFLQKLKTTYDISLDAFLTYKQEIQVEESLAEQNYERFLGTYLTYFYDSSSYMQKEDFFQKNVLKYGVLIILPQNNKLTSYCLFFKQLQDALYAKQQLDNFENTFKKIEYVLNHKNLTYKGTLETSQNQIFIFLKSFNDQSLIILNNPPSNKTYVGGLGTSNSVSRGREHMPTAQYILLSRHPLSLPEGEIYNLLSLGTTEEIDLYSQSEKLLELFKNLYLSENEKLLGFDEHQKKKIFESALEAIVFDAIETNVFRFAKVSAKDDDYCYTLIKKGE